MLCYFINGFIRNRTVILTVVTVICLTVAVTRITFDSNEDLEIKKAAFLSSFGYHPFIHTQEREPLMDEADFKALINAVMASRNRTSFKYKRIRPWAKYRIDNGDKGKRCGQEEVLVMVDSRTSLKGAEMRRALRKVFKENENSPDMYTVRYFLGTSTNLVHPSLKEELKNQTDIIFMGVPDKNYTLKHAAMFQWQQSYCPNVNTVILMRDTTVIIVPRILFYMSANIDWNDYLLCQHEKGGRFLGICNDEVIFLTGTSIKNRISELTNQGIGGNGEDNTGRAEDWHIINFEGMKSTLNNICTPIIKEVGGSTQKPMVIRNLRSGEEVQKAWKLLLDNTCKNFKFKDRVVNVN